MTYGGKPSDFEGGGELCFLEFEEQLLLNSGTRDGGGGVGSLVHRDDAFGVVVVELRDALGK